MQDQMSNPFTPTFGGPPERFFGRTELIKRVSHALSHPESPDSALFVTGARGSGKTALLEKLSGLARAERWIVVDTHSLGAAAAIAAQLTGASATLDAKATPQVSLPGGVSLSLGADASAASPGPRDLLSALVSRASRLSVHRGIFITVDEIQKIEESDMEEICAAVQMARRKGLPVALMLAGLPESKELVASYRGCTFMQRVEDVRLWGLTIDETMESFEGLLSLAPDIVTSPEVVWELASCSQGYPYLIQLVGYWFVKHLRETYPLGTKEASVDDVHACDEDVYRAFRANVLVPSTRGLGKDARRYLYEMAHLLDGEGFARTADIAKAMDKDTKQLSSCRQGLINRRLVVMADRGTVCYGIPFMQRFSLETGEGEYQPLRGRFVPR